MYYLVDFAFENISDKALARISQRASLKQAGLSEGKYKNKLGFTPKQSVVLETDNDLVKRKKLKRNAKLQETPVQNLNKQLDSFVKNPQTKYSGLQVRQIGKKGSSLGAKAFPNSQTKGVKGFLKSAKVLGSNLAPHLVVPTTLIGGMIGVNKLRGKTWNGKEKYE